MFEERPLAFLALPSQGNASLDLATQIGDVLKQQGIEAMRPDDISTANPVVEQVQASIRRADLVVADLTGRNPNVLFEVGMALGLNKPILLLSQSPSEDMPIDLAAHQVARYRPDDVATVRRYVEFWLRDFLRRRETTKY
jgi:nucleoside 2-deoxyribosyltransferase